MSDRIDPPALTIAGLGQLGLPLAVALAQAGFTVTGIDPDAARRSEATRQAQFAVLAQASPPVWQQTRILVSVLPSDTSMQTLLSGPSGALACLPEGAIHLCIGTLSVALCGALASLHTDAGQHFAACPVFGRPDEAWARDLTALFGPAGPDKDGWHAAAQRILAVFAPRRHAVPSPAAACAIKLAGNLMIASAISTLTEASRFVRAHGAEASTLHQVITGKLFRGPVYEGVGGRVTRSADSGQQGTAPAGFTVQLGLKDITLLLAAATAAGVATPVGDLVQTTLARATEADCANFDWADLPACLPNG